MTTLNREERVLMAVHSGHSSQADVARVTGLHWTQTHRLLHLLVRDGHVKSNPADGWSLTSAGYTRVQAIQEGGVE